MNFRKKVASSISALKRVRPFIPLNTAIKIYKGVIEPHFDYGSVFRDGLSQELIEKLQKLQNRAARVITKSSFDTNSSYLLNSLGWDRWSIRRAKKRANLMYKCVNELAPDYLCNMYIPRVSYYNLTWHHPKVIPSETKNWPTKANHQLQRCLTMERSSCM